MTETWGAIWEAETVGLKRSYSAPMKHANLVDTFFLLIHIENLQDVIPLNHRKEAMIMKWFNYNVDLLFLCFFISSINVTSKHLLLIVSEFCLEGVFFWGIFCTNLSLKPHDRLSGVKMTRCFFFGSPTLCLKDPLLKNFGCQKGSYFREIFSWVIGS